MLLSDKLKRRIIIAVTSEQYGKELIDAIEDGSNNLLSANGAPSNLIGNNGDVYVDLVNGDLYSKSNNVWGQLTSNSVSPTSLVTTATYTATTNNYYIGVNRNGPVSIILPVASNGKELIIKDESGNCAVNPITIVGTIDNDIGGAILAINNGALHLIYRSGWRIV